MFGRVYKTETELICFLFIFHTVKVWSGLCRFLLSLLTTQEREREKGKEKEKEIGDINFLPDRVFRHLRAPKSVDRLTFSCSEASIALNW